MADTSSTLEILVKLQDQLSGAISSMGGNVQSSFDKMAENAKKVGEGMIVAGGAIVGALGFAVDAAMKEQTANETLGTALEALKQTAISETASKKDNAAQTEVLTNQQHQLQAQIEQTAFSLTQSTGKHKDHAAAVEAGQAKIDTLKLKLEKVNEELDKHKTLLQNATANINDEMEAVEAAKKANENFGFSFEDTGTAVANLLPHTKNLQQAIADTNIAMDLARYKNETLGEASQQLGLLLEGGGRAAKQLGINMKETATPMEALAQVQNLVSGQAEAASKTMAVQMDIAKAKFNDTAAVLGTALLPVLTNFIGKVNNIVTSVQNWAEAHPGLVKGIVDVAAVLGPLLILGGTFLTSLGLISKALTDVKMVMGLWGEVQTFLSTVSIPGLLTALLPVLPAILAITAAVTALIIVYKQWQGLQQDQAAAQQSQNALNNINQTAADKVASLKASGQDAKAAQLSNYLTTQQLNSPTKVQDAIITPTGQLIQSDAADYLIATKTPGALGGGKGGNNSTIVVNFNNASFGDQNAAIKFGNQIAKIVNQQLKLRTV